MQTWKDAVNLSIRRCLLRLILNDQRKLDSIKINEIKNQVDHDLRRFHQLHTDDTGLRPEEYVRYLERFFRNFSEGFRIIELDAQKSEEERLLFDPKVRTGNADVFMPNELSNSSINRLLQEVLNVIDSAEGIKPLLGITELIGHKQQEIEGDLQMATPFYLFFLEGENFTGLDCDLKKEQAKAINFLRSNIAHILKRHHDYQPDPKRHFLSVNKKERLLEEIEEESVRRFYCFTVTFLSNLLWHVIYPHRLDGQPVLAQEVRKKFKDARQFLESVQEIFDKDDYQAFYFKDELSNLIFYIDTCLKNLTSVYEREKISNLSLRSIATNFQVLSRKLCELVFFFIYEDPSLASALGADILKLNGLMAQDPRILSVFDKRLPYEKSLLVNQNTETIFDVLILFANATSPQKKKLLEALEKSSASQVSKRFSKALASFKTDYLIAIKEKMRVVEGWSYLNRKRKKIAREVARRLLPLSVLSMLEYGYTIKSAQDEVGTDEDSSDDSYSAEEQIKEITQSFLKDREYHFDILHFVDTDNHEALNHDLKQLPIIQFHCHKLADFLIFANHILDSHRVYLKYREFRDYCKKYFEATYQKAVDIDEYILRTADLLEDKNLINSEDATLLRSSVQSIRAHFEEFNRYYQELTAIADSPNPSDEEFQHIKVIGERFANKFEQCFEASIEREELTSQTNSKTNPKRLGGRLGSSPDLSKVTLQMVQLSSLIGSCFSSLTWLSQNGYKGGYLKQLYEPLLTPPFCEQKAKKIVWELARIACTYRKGALGFHADYANSRSANTLIEAIMNAEHLYPDLRLAYWLFGETVALEIESSDNPRARIRQALISLKEDFSWADEDRNLSVPRVVFSSSFGKKESHSPWSGSSDDIDETVSEAGSSLSL
jgi:hypothetical protein